MNDNNNDDMNFKQAYEVLEKNAEKLKSENNMVDVDELVTIMEQSQKAYEICQQRIEAVKKTIERFAGDTNEQDPNAQNQQQKDDS